MSTEPAPPFDFSDKFRHIEHPAMVRAERAVIGADYGALSYTTVALADELARCLDRARVRLCSTSEVVRAGPATIWLRQRGVAPF